MNKSQRASETQSNIKKKQQNQWRKDAQLGVRPTVDVQALRVDLQRRKENINTLKCLLSDPFRRATPEAKSFVRQAIADYKSILEASVGMPTYTDNATLQYEAPNDIPTVPLSGLVPIQRTAYIVKQATGGTAAGGFFATLTSGDFAPWASDISGKIFRVKQISSWTVPRADGGVQQGTFAGVSIASSAGSAGTEVTPIWSENFEPVGQGFAGIITKYPLGAYPLYTANGAAETVCLHYTSLGGTGGVTGIPVIFHVVIESLI
jgi:hypothetical protein